MKYILYKILTFSIRKIREYYYIYYNKFILHILGVKYGINLKITNQCYIQKHNNGEFLIGNNFYFTSGEAFNPLSRNIKGCIYIANNAHIKIGNNVGISSSCLWANNSITIKDNVKIGGDCIIIDTDAHSLNFQDRRIPEIDILNTLSKPIIIENDVLIGTRSIILKGVHIGANSIIGAGSVVTKNIPENCIACGNPAKIIKYINPDIIKSHE